MEETAARLTNFNPCVISSSCKPSLLARLIHPFTKLSVKIVQDCNRREKRALTWGVTLGVVADRVETWYTNRD